MNNLVDMALAFANAPENRRHNEGVNWDLVGADMYLALSNSPEWHAVRDFAQDNVDDALRDAMSIYAMEGQ